MLTPTETETDGQTHLRIHVNQALWEASASHHTQVTDTQLYTRCFPLSPGCRLVLAALCLDTPCQGRA